MLVRKGQKSLMTGGVDNMDLKYVFGVGDTVLVNTEFGPQGAIIMEIGMYCDSNKHEVKYKTPYGWYSTDEITPYYTTTTEDAPVEIDELSALF
mgnify:CR=1 FL=1